jgi:hypothetical protein
MTNRVDPRQDPRQRVADRVLAFWPEIVVAARKRGISPAIMAGLVCQESAGDPQARRYEGHYRWLFGDDAHEKACLPEGVDLAEDLVLQRYSWGLCQVMGAVAREYGFAGHLEELADPAVNLGLGARHLANKIKQAKGDLRRGLLLYNGGGYKAYPEKVLAWAAYFNRKEKEDELASDGSRSVPGDQGGQGGLAHAAGQDVSRPEGHLGPGGEPGDEGPDRQGLELGSGLRGVHPDQPGQLPGGGGGRAGGFLGALGARAGRVLDNTPLMASLKLLGALGWAVLTHAKAPRQEGSILPDQDGAGPLGGKE